MHRKDRGHCETVLDLGLDDPLVDDSNDLEEHWQEQEMMAAAHEAKKRRRSLGGGYLASVRRWTKEWRHECAFACRSITAPGDPRVPMRARCWRVLNLCALFAIVATGTVALAAALTLAFALAAVAAASVQTLAMYALTPTCLASGVPLRCAMGSVAVALPTECVWRHHRRYPYEMVENFALRSGCLWESLLLVSLGVIVLDAALGLAVFLLMRRARRFLRGRAALRKRRI